MVIPKSSFPIALLCFLGASGPPAPANTVATIAGFEATFPGGKFGIDNAQGIPMDYVKIPAAKEYYLDYQVQFESGWAWVKGGKLPGLVGGTHTSGCRPIQADGWSARFMWHQNAGAHLYYYHQNRQNNCGDETNFSAGHTLTLNGWNRITEKVVINNPGKSDGSAEAWLNGVKVVTQNNVKWRGNVSATTALVDQVSLQTFYGGSTSDWSPPRTTHARFSGFVVRTDLPDFSIPFVPITSPVTDPTHVSDRTAPEGGSGLRGVGSRQGYVVAYLGNGRLPAFADGEAGERLGLFDMRGRLLGYMAWDGVRRQWNYSTRFELPSQPGLLAVHSI